jgi:deoxyribose-phosphate aldolase
MMQRMPAPVDQGAVRVVPLSRRDVARMIDHTLLRPDATPHDIATHCDEARIHGFATVCVHPTYVAAAATALADDDTAVCTVVGFPLGANRTAIKAAETRQALTDGAHEIDMVMSIGHLKAGEVDRVRDDIAAVVAAAEGRLVKVILEIAFLTPDEIALACGVTVDAGAGFVKTSTGFGPGGATVDAVRLMRREVGPAVGVKAAGGIRDAAGARAMIGAGASRLGTSASLAILAAWSHTS